MGIVDALRDPLPDGLATALRVYVGLTGAVILLVAVTTSISGFTRLAHSLGEHGQLPRDFGRLNRRTLVSPQAIVAAALISIALMIGTSFVHDDVAFLASLFSFGVLAAFTAAQLAVIKLRFSEPELPRPYRAPWNVQVRGVEVPRAGDRRLGRHLRDLDRGDGHAPGRALRRAGLARRRRGRLLPRPPRPRRGPARARRRRRPRRCPESEFTSILVPMKLGAIGEEMIATAVKLAERPRRARRGALRDPRAARPAARGRARRAGGGAPPRRSRRRGCSAPTTASTCEVETIRARSIGDAIVGEATRRGNDLIVVGSAPRWRRQSRFFSPTVEFVLRKAPCEVLVVAFPEGVMEEDGSGRGSELR